MTVIHIQLPENIETSRSRSIWQKWRKSICGTSNESFDIKQAENQFPYLPKKFLNEMYNKLCNFFKLLMEKGSTKDSP
jgi:ATP-dependent DNA helicase RecQ